MISVEATNKEQGTHSIFDHVDRRRPDKSRGEDPEYRISSPCSCKRT